MTDGQSKSAGRPREGLVETRPSLRTISPQPLAFSLAAIAVFCALVLALGCGQQGPSQPADTRPEPTLTPDAQQGAPEPHVADGFVFRPTFDTTRGQIAAGTAFAASISGQTRPIILTAIHLIGTAGGLPDDVEPKEVPGVIQDVSLNGCFDDSTVKIPVGSLIPIASAAPLDEPSEAGDVLAFWGSEGSSLNPAPLAAKLPGEGERVWLVAQLVEGAPPTQRLHPAVFIKNEGDAIVYRFDNPKVSTRATSGAPVVNTAGEVIAINLGGGRDLSDGSRYGFGNPVTRFVPALTTAMSQQGQ